MTQQGPTNCLKVLHCLYRQCPLMQYRDTSACSFVLTAFERKHSIRRRQGDLLNPPFRGLRVRMEVLQAHPCSDAPGTVATNECDELCRVLSDLLKVWRQATEPTTETTRRLDRLRSTSWSPSDACRQIPRRQETKRRVRFSFL